VQTSFCGCAIIVDNSRQFFLIVLTIEILLLLSFTTWGNAVKNLSQAIFEIYLISLSTSTRSLMPHLRGFFSINVMKGQRVFSGMNCSSAVSEKSHIYIWLTHGCECPGNIMYWCESVCSRPSASSVWFTIKFQILQDSINSTTWQCFQKNRNPLSFIVKKWNGWFFRTALQHTGEKYMTLVRT